MHNIIETPSPNHYVGRKGYKPEIITIHISTNTLKSMDSWFNTVGSQASSNYGISEDGLTIHKYVSEADAPWTNGGVHNPSAKIVLERPGINPNYYTISIENAGTDLAKASEGQRQTLYALICDIAKRNNIPLDRRHVLGHWEIDSLNRNNCPSPDHTLIDKIVATCQMLAGQPEEMVSLLVPKSKVALVQQFISGLK